MTTLQGSWIWYEIITPDPEGSKAFYDAVVGWNIQPTHEHNPDYGFIVNADGGMTGGILRLAQDMADNGARPNGWAISAWMIAMRWWPLSRAAAAKHGCPRGTSPWRAG